MQPQVRKLFPYFLISVLALAVLPAFATWQKVALSIGNGNDWQFVNGAWHDAGEGVIKPPTKNAEYYYAFYKPLRFADLDASFKIRMETNHCDVGFIVRAQDPSHFYLISFPNGGQQYRAQHFWAAISKSDGSGYLRFIKLQMVRRVPSNLGIWHNVKVHVEGTLLEVEVDGYPAISLHDSTFLSPGRIGLSGFTKFSIKDVVVNGRVIPGQEWDSAKTLPKNYFIPVPDTTYGRWQHAGSLVRTPNGGLLLAFESGKGQGVTLVARSKDEGRTWSKPQRMDALKGYRIFSLKDGKLIALNAHADEIWRMVSTDNGHTWQPPVRAKTGPYPSDPPKLGGTYGVQLRDGTLILYLIGLDSTTPKGANVLTWSIIHCQAWSIRSTDDGLTWSAPVNLDSNPTWPRGGHIEGNLDLTEAVGAQTSDGRIITLIRPIYSPWMWETWSNDDGKSWGPAVRGPFPGYAPQPMLRTSSGAILIATRFPGLTVHVSYDDARNWDEGTYISSSIWVMGGMLEVKPNLILMVYMDSFEGPLRAQFFRIGPEGLEPVRY